MKTSSLRLTIVLLSLGLIHCSGVKFGSESGQTAASSSASGSKSGGGDASGALNQGSTPGDSSSGTVTSPGDSGGTGTTGGGTVADSPKVKFVGPPCIRGTACLVEFDLDAAVSHNFDFDWRTNDTLYQQPGAPAGYTYGKPGVHYVSTSGHITFLAGETVKKVYVQNINPDNIQIIIGVIMSVCTYNGNLSDCTSFFH